MLSKLQTPDDRALQSRFNSELRNLKRQGHGLTSASRSSEAYRNVAAHFGISSAQVRDAVQRTRDVAQATSGMGAREATVNQAGFAAAYRKAMLTSGRKCFKCNTSKHVRIHTLHSVIPSFYGVLEARLMSEFGFSKSQVERHVSLATSLDPNNLVFVTACWDCLVRDYAATLKRRMAFGFSR